MATMGTKPRDGHARGQRDGVLFADADVEDPVRESLRRRLKTRRLAHRGGNRDESLILLHETQHGLPEDLAVGGRSAVRRHDRSAPGRGSGAESFSAGG